MGRVIRGLAQYCRPEPLDTVGIVCKFILIQERKVGRGDLLRSKQALVGSLLLEDGEAELWVGLRVVVHRAKSDRSGRFLGSCYVFQEDVGVYIKGPSSDRRFGE